MQFVRTVIVFDAADLAAVSSFWAEFSRARLCGGVAQRHYAYGEGRGRVQLAPNHVPPDWPNGIRQQMHLDLRVDVGPTVACGVDERYLGRIVACTWFASAHLESVTAYHSDAK